MGEITVFGPFERTVKNSSVHLSLVIKQQAKLSSIFEYNQNISIPFAWFHRQIGKIKLLDYHLF